MRERHKTESRERAERAAEKEKKEKRRRVKKRKKEKGGERRGEKKEQSVKAKSKGGFVGPCQSRLRSAGSCLLSRARTEHSSRSSPSRRRIEGLLKACSGHSGRLSRNKTEAKGANCVGHHSSAPQYRSARHLSSRWVDGSIGELVRAPKASRSSARAKLVSLFRVIELHNNGTERKTASLFSGKSKSIAPQMKGELCEAARSTTLLCHVRLCCEALSTPAGELSRSRAKRRGKHKRVVHFLRVCCALSAAVVSHLGGGSWCFHG